MVNVINVKRKTPEELAEEKRKQKEAAAALGKVESTVSKTAAERGLSAEEARKQVGEQDIIGQNRQVTIEEARAAQQQKLQQKEEQASITIPRAEEVTGQTANVFTDFLGQTANNVIPFGPEGQGRVPLISKLVETNLGQAMTGEIFLNQIKENPEFQKQVLDLTDYMNKAGLTPEQVSSDPYMQAALRIQLNENDLKVLKQGKAEINKFSSLIEGLPITKKVTQIAGGALTPTTAFSKINSLDKQVKDLTSQMDKWNEAIASNPQIADQYESLVNEAEQKILDAQSRIKLLILQSPIYQNSPEDVENIQINLDTALGQTAKIRSKILQVKYAQPQNI